MSKLLAGALILGALIMTPLSALAQDAQIAPPAKEAPAETEKEESSPQEHSFSQEEWRSLVSGKTLYYEINGRLVGREYYVPNSNRAVFIYWDGECFDGTWAERDGVFCFAYDGTHCFRHVRRGDDIFAVETTGDEQLVSRITQEPLSCDKPLSS